MLPGTNLHPARSKGLSSAGEERVVIEGSISVCMLDRRTDPLPQDKIEMRAQPAGPAIMITHQILRRLPLSTVLVRVLLVPFRGATQFMPFHKSGRLALLRACYQCITS